MIEDREYLKRDLARIYTPHTRQAKSAMKKLREETITPPAKSVSSPNISASTETLFRALSAKNCRKTLQVSRIVRTTQSWDRGTWVWVPVPQR